MKRFLLSLLAAFTSDGPRSERRASLQVEEMEERYAMSTMSPALVNHPAAGQGRHARGKGKGHQRGFVIEGGRGANRAIIIEGGHGVNVASTGAAGKGTNRAIIAIHNAGVESPGVARGFNPQPEPPGLPLLKGKARK